MRQKRVKWIKKVVVSRHPKILEMIKQRVGEDAANNMTYKQVIKMCKTMWLEKTPGVEQWKIHKEKEK